MALNFVCLFWLFACVCVCVCVYTHHSKFTYGEMFGLASRPECHRSVLFETKGLGRRNKGRQHGMFFLQFYFPKLVEIHRGIKAELRPPSRLHFQRERLNLFRMDQSPGMKWNGEPGLMVVDAAASFAHFAECVSITLSVLMGSGGVAEWNASNIWGKKAESRETVISFNNCNRSNETFANQQICLRFVASSPLRNHRMTDERNGQELWKDEEKF